MADYLKAWQCVGCGQLAWSKPRGGEWERSYRELQAKARKLLS